MAKWITVRKSIVVPLWHVDMHVDNTYTAHGEYAYRSLWSAKRAAKRLSAETGWRWGVGKA